MALSDDAVDLGYEAHDPGLVDQTPTANDNTNTTAGHLKALQDASADFLDEAAGDARYAQKSNNLSDITASAARSNLELGDSATKDIGTSAGTVAAGDHIHSAYSGSVLVDGKTFDIVNGIITGVTP